MGGFFQPIFFARSHFEQVMPGRYGRRSRANGWGQQTDLATTHWQTSVERTVTGLGYELVDVERSAGGLLRVFIDRVPGRTYDTGAGEFVTVDDCERVTRQLQYVLEVDGVDYAAARGLVARARPAAAQASRLRTLRRQRGRADACSCRSRAARTGAACCRTREAGWRLRCCRRPPAGAEQALDFDLDEVREARLVPVLDFKGRRARAGAPRRQPRGRGA